MAFLQVALLSLGTLFSVMMRFTTLPVLMEDLKERRPVHSVLQTLIGSHVAHLLWIVYCVQIWDADFAIPNIVLAVMTLGFAGFVVAIARIQAGSAFRYAIAVPLVLLVLWRTFPAVLTGVCAGVLQQFEVRPAWERISSMLKTQQTTPVETMLSALGTFKCLAWVALGFLKADYCILATFAAGLAVHGSSLALSKLYSTPQKPARRA